MESKQKRDEFRLRIAGVAVGKYTFSIACDKTFFELSDISELQDGLIDLQILMDVSEKMLNLQFHFNGKVIAPCDRCLDPVEMTMAFREQLIVNLVPIVDENVENDDTIWMMDENIYELDIFHFVYETIRLALPHKIVHSEDKNGNSTCNPDVIKKLEELTVKEEPTEIDPRWEALKNIKLD